MGSKQVVLFDNRRQERWEYQERMRLNGDVRRIQHEAVLDAAREHTKDMAKNKQKFNDLVVHSREVLFKLTSVFPFDMFPNTITIDQEKITVKFREFFASEEIRSIYIKNIAQLYVDTGPFFATINILDQMLSNDASLIKIPYLKKGEAMKARRIIQGLLVAHSENVDVARIQDDNLVPKLETLGRMR